MRYVLQLLIIIFFSFLGEVLHMILPLPFPSAIYGIILLFMALELRIVRLQHIREVSTTLIKAMPVMFVPPAVRLMDTWTSVREEWPGYLAITIVSTFVVMGVSGWITQSIIRRKKNNTTTKQTEEWKN